MILFHKVSNEIESVSPLIQYPSFQSSLTEYNIREFGWRGAYIWNAGLSLQIVVFGALIFPLRPITEANKEQREVEENLHKPARPLKGFKTSRSRMLLEKSLNHRYDTKKNSITELNL